MQQFLELEDTSPLLDAKQNQFILQVTGTFLFYARTIHCTMFPALSTIVVEQAAPTVATMEKTKQIFDFMALQDEAIVKYKAMTLANHSNAS